MSARLGWSVIDGARSAKIIRPDPGRAHFERGSKRFLQLGVADQALLKGLFDQAHPLLILR
jgi:hypothetical protein